MRVSAPRRRYHWHPPGVLFLLMTVLVGAAAIQRGENLLVWIFATALSWIVVSGVVSGAMMMALEVRRIVPPHAQAGTPMRVKYRVRSRGRVFGLFSLSITERTSGLSGLPGLSCPMEPARFVHCGPGESVIAEGTLRIDERQRLLLTTIRCQAAFPFGLILKSVEFTQESAVIVHPRVVPIDDRMFRRAIAGTGPHAVRRVSRPGWGDDLHGLREFRAGDPLRSVAWKRSARADGLLVIERAAATSTRMMLVLDLRHPDRGDPARAEEAISFAASLLAHAESHGWLFGLEIVGAEEAPVGLLRGRGHLIRCLDELSVLDLSSIVEDHRTGAGSSSPAHRVWVTLGDASLRRQSGWRTTLSLTDFAALRKGAV